MQLYSIIVVIVILLADGGLSLRGNEQEPTASTGWIALTIVSLGILFLLALAGWRLHWCQRRINHGRGVKYIMHAERVTRWTRVGLLILHIVAVLLFNWLDTVREVLGNLILIDECVAVLPAIVGWLIVAWLFYPIDRRLHEALLIRRLDEGKPIHEFPTRGRYVLDQSRIGLLVLLVPLLVILLLAESIDLALGLLEPWNIQPWVGEVATVAAALVVFVSSPWIARLLLHLEPLAEGPVRESLLQICRQHRVKVRDVLLWKTSGMMTNAAVMGLFGVMRYVLLTDVLLETMPPRELQAVMAHEVGHVRKHHMPWMLAVLFATILLVELMGEGFWWLMNSSLMSFISLKPLWSDTTFLLMGLIIAWLIFGWVSRRFERQADTFAVVHLNPPPQENVELTQTQPNHSSQLTENQGEQINNHNKMMDEDKRIHIESVTAMCDALGRIARLHGSDLNRRSWRHGSIAWRQAYLHQLVGQLEDRIPNDRVVRLIQLITVVLLILVVLIVGFLFIFHTDRDVVEGADTAVGVVRSGGLI